MIFQSSLLYRPWGMLVGVSGSYPTKAVALLLGESRAYDSIYRDPIIKARQSWDPLILIMGTPPLVTQYLCFEFLWDIFHGDQLRQKWCNYSVYVMSHQNFIPLFAMLFNRYLFILISMAQEVHRTVKQQKLYKWKNINTFVLSYIISIPCVSGKFSPRSVVMIGYAIPEQCHIRESKDRVYGKWKHKVRQST